MTNSNSDEIIRLTVGNTLFLTSKSTLLKCADGTGYFSGMFSGLMPTTKLDDGSIFIDRDPHIFGTLLKILQGYSFDPEHFQEPERSHLFEEAEFFGYQSISCLNYPDVEFRKGKPRNEGDRDYWYTVPTLEFTTPLLTISIEVVTAYGKQYDCLKVNMNEQPIFKRWVENMKKQFVVSLGGVVTSLEDMRDPSIKFNISSSDCINVKNEEFEMKKSTTYTARLDIKNVQATRGYGGGDHRICFNVRKITLQE